MKNLLSMEHLSNEEIMMILNRAQHFENGENPVLQREFHVANLFFEPSTRTKTSFEMAERRLGCTVIPFDAEFSKDDKGRNAVRYSQNIGNDRNRCCRYSR